MTAPNTGTPGQPSQQGWVHMPVPSDAQIRAAQTQRPLNGAQQPQLGAYQYQQMQPGLQHNQQIQQQPQQPQMQMPMTQVVQTQEPYQQLPAPQLYQPQQPQAPQQMPPSQQQPYLVTQQNFSQPQQPQQGGYSPQMQQYMPQMQNPQQQPQQVAGLRVDANGRILAQPGIPQELVGRTPNEMLAIYNQIRQAYVETQLQPAQPPAQQPQQRQPQQPINQQVPATRKASDFWSDPIGTIQNIVAEATRPVQQFTMQQQIEGVRQQLAQIAPDFAQYEAGVINRLRGQPAEVLTNPEAWRYAYLIEKGEQQFRPQGQRPNNGFQQVGGNQQQQPQFQQTWQPAIFSENPSAPQAGDMNAQQQLSQDELAMASKFGKSPEQWLAAKQGRFF